MPEKKPQSGASVESLQQALDALAAQLAALTARLEKLETAGSVEPVVAAPAAEAPAQPVDTAAPAAKAPAVEPAPAEDAINEELLLVLSAAVAAYLGKRPHIRAIRLVGSNAWAQQGRVFVQASHQLNIAHDA